MKSILLKVALFVLVLVPSTLIAQAVPVVESFDSVAVPALPVGWSSVSLSGSQNAVTTTTSPHTGPNAALIPAPSSVSKTALVSKPYSFSAAAPTYSLSVRFQHRRGTEANFDGVVLEVSYNGAEFVDVTHPSIAGTFVSGAYNGTVSSGFGNPLAGRAAWTGASAIYEGVDISIPVIPDNTTIQFRLVVGTDTIVGGAGYQVDSFSLHPKINLVSFVSPSATEIRPGSVVSVTVSSSNPSSLLAPPAAEYISAVASTIKSIAFSRSAVRQRIGQWLSAVSLIEPIPSLGSDDVSVSVQDIVGQSAAKFTLTNSTIFPSLSGASTAVSFISSSPPIPSGALNAEPIIGVINPCAPPPLVPPFPEAGRIVFYLSPLSCSYGQAALAYQARGAVALIAFAPFPIVPPLVGEYPSPVVTEPATVDLTIPVFTIDFLAPGPLVVGFGAPGTSSANLEGLNGAENRTIAVSVSTQPSGDLKLGDNIVTTLINVVTDVDGDSTPDIRDGCKNDSAKIAPGPCGCGVADSDANSNGVPDCQTSADFKAQVTRLKDEVAKLSIKSKNFRTQKEVVKGLLSAVTAVGVNSAGSILTTSGTISISALTQKVDKAVGSVLKAKAAAKLSSAKKSVAKEISKLLAGIA